MLNFIEIFCNFLSEKTKKDKSLIEKTISLSSKGEITSSIAFKIAKETNRKPEEIAEEIVNGQQNIFDYGIIKAENGYLNFYVNERWFFSSYEFKKKDQTIVIEGPSVNPNKPWHVGHLRNAVISASIANILKEAGYQAIKIDYINDAGLQVAESYYYYKKFGKTSNTGKFDVDIGLDYVKAHEFAQKEDSKKEIEKMMEKIEKENDKEFYEFIKNVVKAQRETAKDYIKHDFIVYESHVMKVLYEKAIKTIMGLENVKMIETGNLAGCVCLEIEKGTKNPYKVLIRKNKIPTYLCKDIVFHLWKTGKICCLNFAFNEYGTYESTLENGYNFYDVRNPIIINVVGEEQRLNQELLKECLVKMKILKEHEFKHLAYGLVRKNEEKFSGRKGTWIGYTADDLLNEGIKKIEKGDKRKIALAAIKYSFLKMNNKSPVNFDWEKALSTEGDSGVYLLYSYKRAESVLKKYMEINSIQQEQLEKELLNFENELKMNEKVYLNDEERNLMREIWFYPYYVNNASKNLEPSVIANYSFNLANLFNSFYEKNQIINSKEEKKRLLITRKFLETMRKCLWLLNIEPPEAI